jgi:uncharacterized protein
VKRLLVDTGPLVAILDAGDAAHPECAGLLPRVRGRLITTWPVVTEAMYLLQASHEAQQALLSMVSSGTLEVADIAANVDRIAELMGKYKDVPMDFSDASQVVVAERERLDTIFTLDEDFRIYRIGGRRAFRIVP